MQQLPFFAVVTNLVELGLAKSLVPLPVPGLSVVSDQQQQQRQRVLLPPPYISTQQGHYEY